ncbi:unnamed protein product [Macrosiphum euphorbiae]|uniref:Uncharacterized protein n=1 Tax=Macrosiphum euphorbiae TaxID=13131 RepID=A0AAV0XLS0_9HEMI|nr:unnamed protein product [Macrosiphum euphorbiae]
MFVKRIKTRWPMIKCFVVRLDDITRSGFRRLWIKLFVSKLPNKSGHRDALDHKKRKIRGTRGAWMKYSREPVSPLKSMTSD